MAKIKVDFDDILKKGCVVEFELNRAIEEAIEKRIALVEIIASQGKGELKKNALRFLAQPKIKKLYHRIEKDDKNFSRVLVHFKHRSKRKHIGLYGYERRQL